MATLKINGTQYTLDVEPEMPCYGPCGMNSDSREQIWLRRGFLRRLHGAGKWQSGEKLCHACCGCESEITTMKGLRIVTGTL